MYINIDVREALRLWTNGWCWNALAKLKYNCHKETVKNRVGALRTSENQNLHCKRHGRYCPLCKKFPVGQEKLF